MKKTAEEFLRDKGILTKDKKQFVINYPDGTSFSVNDLLEEYADQVKPKWISGRFYVVENSKYEEGMIDQLSNGFEDFQDAIKFLNTDYNKAWHKNSFIINRVDPLPEKP